MGQFKLPEAITTLIGARNSVRDHYGKVLKARHSDVVLKFTLDGNLVGDIGEAIAVELFGIRLVEMKANPGIDGHTSEGKTVQVKATGTGRGPAFSGAELSAQHLLFFDLNFEQGCGEVVFNGPERYVRDRLPGGGKGPRSITPKMIRELNKLVKPEERLACINKA